MDWEKITDRFGVVGERPVLQLEQGSERAVFNGVNDHPREAEFTGLQQRHHQVVAQGPDRGFPLNAGHDVVGLGLVNPDRHLTAACRIA